MFTRKKECGFCRFWSCFYSQCYSQPMLKCDLNNTPFLISLLELKWFHRPLALEALCSPQATRELGQAAGSREPGSLQWQPEQEESIRFRCGAPRLRAVAPGSCRISEGQLGPFGENSGPSNSLGVCGCVIQIPWIPCSTFKFRYPNAGSHENWKELEWTEKLL